MIGSQVVHEFQKNALEKVRIELSEYMGRDILAIRVYFLVDGTPDDWRPSKKGISMDIKHLDELARGINLATERWNEENNEKSML